MAGTSIGIAASLFAAHIKYEYDHPYKNQRSETYCIILLLSSPLTIIDMAMNLDLVSISDLECGFQLTLLELYSFLSTGNGKYHIKVRLVTIVFFIRAFDRSCCSSDGLSQEHEEQKLLDPYGNPAYKAPIYPDQYFPPGMDLNQIETVPKDELDSEGFI